MARIFIHGWSLAHVEDGLPWVSGPDVLPPSLSLAIMVVFLLLLLVCSPSVLYWSCLQKVNYSLSYGQDRVGGKCFSIFYNGIYEHNIWAHYAVAFGIGLWRCLFSHAFEGILKLLPTVLCIGDLSPFFCSHGAVNHILAEKLSFLLKRCHGAVLLLP